MLCEKGCDGHQLHGGGADRAAKGGMLESYNYMDGKLFAGMVVVEFMLAVRCRASASVPRKSCLSCRAVAGRGAGGRRRRGCAGVP